MRRTRGWSQEQAAKVLEPYLGYRLSRAAFSQAERSLYRGKIRRFDADEIVAFARAFEVPVPAFFGPPEPHFRGKRVTVNGKSGNPKAHVTSPPLDRDDMLILAQGKPDQSTYAVIGKVVAASLHEALWKGFYQYLKEHPEELPRALSGKIPAEFWEQMRTARATDTTALAENRLAEQVLDLLRNSASPRRQRASLPGASAALRKSPHATRIRH